jgi:hypothetical protein
MSAGKIFDSAEVQRLDQMLKQQEEAFKQAEKEELNVSGIVRYTLILGGVILVLVLLKKGVGK